MRGLQMMIVPLVLCSLSLALCSLADPKKLGCSKDITSFVLPTGMTVNMNGTTANDSNYIYCYRSRCGDYTCNINAYSFLVNLYRNRYTGYSGSRNNNGLCCNDGTWFKFRALYDRIFFDTCYELPPGYGSYYS